jgi:hypothetical protein
MNVIAILFTLAMRASAPNVTLVSRGATVGAILREASKQTGIAMGAVPETRDEIIIVSVHDAPVKAFQDQLAQAIGARWRLSGGVLRLVRPLNLENEQADAERRIRIEEIKAGLAKLKRRAAEMGEFTAQSAKVLADKLDLINTKYKGHLSDSQGLEATIALEPQTPGGRLAIGAIVGLTPEDVADVGPGERTVYSTNPTAMQRPMPGDLEPLIHQYQSEQQLYTDALKQLPVGQGHGRFAVSEAAAGGLDEVSTVLLVLARSPYNPNLTVDIHLVRKDGTYVGRARSLLDLGETDPHEPHIADGVVPLSQQSLRMTAALDQLQKGKTFIDDHTLLKQLTHPEQFDPLSYVAADGVFALADQQNTIACLPDTAFLEPAFTAVQKSKQLDKGKFSDWLTNNCGVSRGGGWLVASPRRMVETRSLRVDRAVLGQFLRGSIDNGGVVLDDLALFVSRLPTRYMDTLVPLLAFFVLPDLNAGVSDKSIELLRMYGRLTPEQRAEITAGKAITFAGLDPASKADLNHMAFRADPPLSYVVRTVGASAPPPAFVETIQTEVTEAMPRGIPDTASISMNSSSSEAVLADGGGDFVNYEPMNPYRLAYALVHAEQADPTDKREKIKFDLFRFGHTRNVNIRVELTPSIEVEQTLKETSFSRKDASVPYDQLPESFRKAVQAAMIQVRKQRSSVAAPPGGRVPPP